MSAPRKQAAYLWDILNYSRQLRSLVQGHTSESYLSDKRTQLAVERCLEIIGEAAGRLDETTVASLPGLPVAKMRGMRNVLIHGYTDVDSQLVWETAEFRIPEVLAILTPLERGLLGQAPEAKS
jgi:uncharacterized protein with HEPN domain